MLKTIISKATSICKLRKINMYKKHALLLGLMLTISALPISHFTWANGPAIEAIFGDDFLIPPHGLNMMSEQEQRKIIDQNARSAKTTTTVDIMVLYDATFMVRHANPVARINQLINITNTAYIDSGIAMRLKLVHSATIPLSPTTTNRTALDLITNGQAPFNSVSTLRDRYGADLVSFVRPFNQAAHLGCGVAWISGGTHPANMDYGFSVVSEGNDINGNNFFCSEYTFAHEIGHNLGSGHERPGVNPNQGAPCNGGVTGYSCGHGVHNSFGTIMTYLRPRAELFSNPAFSCNGSPCGVSAGSSLSADNAASFNITVTNVAAYRDPVNVSGNLGSLPAVILLLE